MFKTGDTVIATKAFEGSSETVFKYTGRIIRYGESNGCFLVQFKGWNSGHCGLHDSICDDCWFFPKEYLKLSTSLSQKEIIANKIIEMAKRRKSLGYRF